MGPELSPAREPAPAQAPCNEDYHVSNHECVPCPLGQTNEAGDIPEDGDTDCQDAPPYIITQDTNSEGEIDCPSNYIHIVDTSECENFQGDDFHIFNEGDIVEQSGVKQDIMNDYESNEFDFFNIRGGRCHANHPVGCWLTNPTARDQPWTLLHYEECSDPRRKTTAEDFITNSLAQNYGVCERQG